MSARKKVAILGGGCGAMTAAYYLSCDPELRKHLEITVYQLGWRLGGKGASGRGTPAARIEEHGLHVWGGFYENAFRLMQSCFAELQPAPQSPFQTWDDAFKPYPRVVWQELIEEKWIDWLVDVPVNSGVPGQGGELPTIWQYVQMLFQWIRDLIEDLDHAGVQARLRTPDPELSEQHRWLSEAAARLGRPLEAASPLSLLEAAHERVRTLPAEPRDHSALDHHDILASLGTFHTLLQEIVNQELDDHLGLRRSFILLDLSLAMVRGILRDRILLRGFMSIDGRDFAAWLGCNGATRLALESAPLRAYYDYFFAYEDGDPTRPRMSAGMGLHHLLRVSLTYKGAIFWKMQSGMGDAVFAPLYEVCRKNGVRFRFFHRVKSLDPAADGRSIQRLRIGRQIDLKAGDGDYAPLMDVKGLPSWPAEPLYDQIVDEQARELRQREVNLEDPWTDWNDVGEVVLEKGRDFDMAVLGASVGSFPFICREVLAQNGDWSRMVEALQTIQTQALQIWWQPDVSQLGWPADNVTGTAYAAPLQSWSDMSQVTARETWPVDGEAARTIIYFCGPMKNPPRMPEGQDPGFGRKEMSKAWETAAAWCRDAIHHLYPNATRPEEPRELDWSLLAAPGATGPERFAAQYARANYTPSDRYVLDLPGTSRDRLEADTSGYDNLALAGDWLFTGLGGSVESAVITGLQVAQALTGRAPRIVGEMRSPWPRKRSIRRLL